MCNVVDMVNKISLKRVNTRRHCPPPHPTTLIPCNNLPPPLQPEAQQRQLAAASSQSQAPGLPSGDKN